MSVTRAGRGAMGQIWRIDTVRGSFAVKEMSWSEGWEHVETEVALRDLAAGAGVTAPENIPTVNGGHVLSGPDGARLRAYSWVEGSPVADAETQRGAARWLGTTLARLHGLRVSAAGLPVDPWYEAVPDAGDWKELLSAAAEAKAPWYGELAAKAEQISALGGWVAPASPDAMILCHRDLQSSNVLRLGGQDHALLDWDDVGPAVPERELASVLLRWYTHGSDVDSGAVSEALAAYVAHGGSVDLSEESMSMQLAITLNHIFTQGHVALDADHASDLRDFAGDQLDTTLRSLPEPEGVRKVLALAAEAGR
ncbi:aminoglycoside phosphotransferase family protein [Streptomyces sp. PTY087I2]|uniref:aminoglycoside phosphotransferase family protein n=1 Tax=Streptomyces sp. PTY087I2 TaxID=1819298 RepID=UPI00210040A4|nr:aminoglycoside phosphotransferase family protein [Streptomyces sp. PTY087I2]